MRRSIPKRLVIHEAADAVARYVLNWWLFRSHEGAFDSMVVEPMETINEDGEKVYANGRVSASSSWYDPSLRDRKAAEFEAMAALAGPVAEARTMHIPRWQLFLRGSRHDFERAQDMLRAFAGDEDELDDLVSECILRTRDLVRDSWPAIVALADALLANIASISIERDASLTRYYRQ